MKTQITNERGLALVVALMLLVLLTVMGLAAISTTTTEIQLTANERTDAQAFHSAEAGIKEALYRKTLPQSGTTLIANGGSYAMVDGATFNAAIADPAVVAGGNPDPNWQYNVYFGTPPAGTTNVRSILSASDQEKLNYSTSTHPVTIRYAKESDLRLWGIVDYDKNLDGDDRDLVYYNPATKTRDKAVNPTTGTGTLGVADAGPSGSLTRNQVILLVESYGRSGKATKHILLETTGFPVNPQANSAVQTGIQVNFGGNGFVSGYNHSEDTRPEDENNRNANLYNSNGCDNFSGGE